MKSLKSPPAGFLGKNCDVDIDACALPDNTCPPAAQCMDLPDSLEYTCRVPCPQSLQVGKNILMDSSAFMRPPCPLLVVHMFDNLDTRSVLQAELLDRRRTWIHTVRPRAHSASKGQRRSTRQGQWPFDFCLPALPPLPQHEACSFVALPSEKDISHVRKCVLKRETAANWHSWNLYGLCDKSGDH